MTNDDMIRNIEYLRSKADVSYEEAMALLEKYDGNLMRALVELERQGKLYPPEEAKAAPNAAPKAKPHDDARSKVEGFLSKAMRHRLVIEKGDKAHPETVANLSLPYCAAAGVVAPHVLVGSVALMFVMGYKVRLKKTPAGKGAPDGETIVDKTVNNIKQTASSFAGTARQAAEAMREDAPQEPDDREEDGEVTVE